MSVSSLSQTLQQRILNNLLTNVRADIQKAEELKPGKRFGSTFIKTEVTSANVTRILSDPNQTGIFGKTGLQELAAGFNKLSQGIGKVGSRVISKDGTISKQAGYANLKKYLKKYIETYNGSEVDALQSAVMELAKRADTRLSDASLYNEFLLFVKQSNKVVEINESIFTIPETQHGTINKLFDQYLLKSGTDPVLVEFISANTDAGHLLGIFNQKLYRAFGAVSDTEYGLGELSVDIFKNIAANEREDIAAINKLNSTFSAAFNLMEYIDFLSSSIKTNPEVFVTLSKQVYLNPDKPTSSAEIQLSMDNVNTGNLLTDAGKMLEKLIKSAETAKFVTLAGGTEQVRDPKSANFAQQLEDLFKQIGTVAQVAKQMAAAINVAENKILDNYVKQILKQTDIFADILLNAEGSDSVKTAAVNRVVSTITNKKLPAPSNTKVGKSAGSKNKIPLPKKAPISKLKSTKQSSTSVSAAKKVVRRAPPETETDLVNLLSIISSSLTQRIKENMGDGSRRDILNLRTGRFAESVKVERLSKSRSGMITAFYSYMKNPYATFSEGGAQSQPKSRDPKLLISKSIREIAQQQVANRLRAVAI